jgi:hypothetical protein
MKKVAVYAFLGFALLAARAAHACPSCANPQLWKQTPCVAGNCSPCGWAAYCGVDPLRMAANPTTPAFGADNFLSSLTRVDLQDEALQSPGGEPAGLACAPVEGSTPR